MPFIKFLAVAIGISAFAYYKRYGFRQAWHVLRTGNKDPDFETLDAEYYLGRKAGEKPRGRFWPF